MARYASFGAEPGVQVATNSGWSTYVAWTDGLDADEYPLPIHLAEYGWAPELPALLAQLKAAAEGHPPEAPGLTSILDNFTRLLEKNRGKDAVFVHDGSG